MVLLNVQVVRYEVECPKDQTARDYLQGVFRRVSESVAKSNPPSLDLLVVNSGGFANIAYTLRSFFHDYLNKSLAEAGRKEFCPAMGYLFAGGVNDQTLVDSLKERLSGLDIKLNFITEDRMGEANVVYPLRTS